MTKKITMNWKIKLLNKLATFTGKYYSLDRHFNRRKATAKIRFTKKDKYGGSIIISCGGMNYYFEGTPEIKKYKGGTGLNVVQKTLKYGGWEMDMTHKDNKLPFINNQK